ncbi:hypothetical protein KAR91_67400 [Candidatus Pacearchaeota archaeon]|nr:hypothetical protein [Candidatus Pacearchaeota archaeon]
MPKTIPCWDCKGKGKIRTYPEHLQTGYHDIQCETCNGGGVLSVYTQTEHQETVKKERKACAELCLFLEDAQLNDSYTDALEDCAEAIRGKE